MAAKTFRDVIAWQRSFDLAVSIYVVTKEFPRDETYGLTSQIRRAAVSVSSNIAEGFGRASSKEKDHFYAVAYASLTEIENQLLIAQAVGYLTDETFQELEAKCLETQRILGGLQKVNKQKGAEAILESRT